MGKCLFWLWGEGGRLPETGTAMDKTGAALTPGTGTGSQGWPPVLEVARGLSVLLET